MRSTFSLLLLLATGLIQPSLLEAQFDPIGDQVISYFPQIADGGAPAQKWTTSFTFSNPHRLYSAIGILSLFSTRNGFRRRRARGLVHLAMSTMTIPGIQFISSLQAHAAEVRKKQKACILMWMGGGPPTIDIWDLKPGTANGGSFKPISTAASGVQISEHMPETAKQMKQFSIVRSMSTREGDHGRTRWPS